MVNTKELLIDIQKMIDKKIKNGEATSALKKEKEQRELERKRAEEEYKKEVALEKEHEKKIRGKEQEIEAIKAKIVNDNKKLNDVKTNKEYKALLSEIEGYDKEIGILEEEILELMDQTDDVKKKIIEAQEDFKKIDADFQQKVDDLASRITASQQEGTAMTAMLKEKVQSLPSDVRHELGRLTARNARAVVAVIDGVCQGCFQTLPPQEYIQLKVSSEPDRCSNCNRYIYVPVSS